jgi:hypothetical protein
MITTMLHDVLALADRHPIVSVVILVILAHTLSVSVLHSFFGTHCVCKNCNKER